MNVTLHKLSSNDSTDFQELVNVFGQVFERVSLPIPGEVQVQNLLTKSDFLAVVAKHENQVIGGLTAYVLAPYYTLRPSVYLYDLGVLSEFQRKGIGKALIEYLVTYGKAQGFDVVFVDAESEDTEAIKFYRATGIQSEVAVSQFTYSLNGV